MLGVCFWIVRIIILFDYKIHLVLFLVILVNVIFKGRSNQVVLFINCAGMFFKRCSEICGVNHGFMSVAADSFHSG